MKIKHRLYSNDYFLKLISIFFIVKNIVPYYIILYYKKKFNILNFKKLSKKFPYLPFSYIVDNNLYGLYYILSKYGNKSPFNKIDTYIEHGLFFGDLVKDEQINLKTKNIITFSENRKFHLLKKINHKNIIPIGPYIHYADDLFSEDKFFQVKKSLGKVLLVFPVHSIKNFDTRFEINDFINYIESIKSNYDNIIICMYWLDIIRNNYIQSYLNKKYKIVTAGHRFDICFMSRLKTLIKLSDYTISNSIGTHIGYCIYLQRPHFIFKQKSSQSFISQFNYDHYLNSRLNINENIEIKEKLEIEDAFSVYSPFITEKQYQVSNKYWGFDKIKSKYEFRLIFNK
jgi:hypothetical protein